jgi:paraquat-inducible protein B
VGLFVLIGIVLIGAGTVILGGQDLFAEPVLMETVFNESVQGLEVGSAVKFRGVQLGSVSEIGFAQDYYPRRAPRSCSRTATRSWCGWT